MAAKSWEADFRYPAIRESIKIVRNAGARYLIRAEDVADFRPFQFMNYVGAEITFRISEEVSLSIAIARVSMLLELTRQLPFLFFLQKRIKNRIFDFPDSAVF